MNNQPITKPEPISAKSNWHYDSYFLSQLERLGLRKPATKPFTQELDSPQAKDDLPPPEQTALKLEAEKELQKLKREEVKAKIQMLAASIGINVNIIETLD